MLPLEEVCVLLASVLRLGSRKVKLLKQKIDICDKASSREARMVRWYVVLLLGLRWYDGTLLFFSRLSSFLLSVR